VDFLVHDAAAAKIAADDAQATLARVFEPELIDVANQLCPVTGEAVAKNTVVIVGKRLIRLSSPKCVETVELEPERIVKKALEIRASQDAADAKQKPAEAPPKEQHEAQHAA
jgi:hypothetical protein